MSSHHAAEASQGCRNVVEMTAVGFEPTQLALVELESTPLDHSGKLSMVCAAYGRLSVQHRPGGCISRISAVRKRRAP